MSTFGGLETAYSGLSAARQALDVTGQNITNAGTEGYTRQRVQAHAATAPVPMGPLGAASAQVGQGVVVTGVARLADELLNARLRTATAQAGFADTTATALAALEDSLHEPTDDGLAAQLQHFWTSWQDLANNPDDAPAGQAVIAAGRAVAQQLAAGYSTVASQWAEIRAQAVAFAGQLNNAADQLAKLNGAIRDAVAAGGSANELMDQRDLLAKQIASLAGGTVTQNSDDTVNVLLDGNLLVGGTTAAHVSVAGATDVSAAALDPVRVQWASGQAVGVESGRLAASVALLSPANATGTGGALAETAARYNAVASALAAQVNAVVTSGITNTGDAAGPFFAVDASLPAALGLSVAATDVTQLGVSPAGGLPYDGSLADRVSQLGAAAGSPDALWSALVGGVATAAQNANRQQTITAATLMSAVNLQQAASGVDTDEENIDLVTQQAAYQAAARVLTTVDELLDTLINHTGVVGL